MNNAQPQQQAITEITQMLGLMTKDEKRQLLTLLKSLRPAGPRQTEELRPAEERVQIAAVENIIREVEA